MLKKMFLVSIFIVTPVFTFANNWVHKNVVDEFTDEKKDISYVFAEYLDGVRLIVEDTRWNSKVSIPTGTYVKNVKVLYVRFGKKSIEKYAVTHSTNNRTLFIKDADDFIRNMKKSRFVTVRYTPFNRDRITAKFSLIGYSNSYSNRPLPTYDKGLKQNTKNWSYRNSNISTEPYRPKKEDNPDNYKGQPELKLGKLHAYGIKSIKEFKNNKLMIQAVNGTFALPKDKFNKAEKINFNSSLNY